MEIIKLLLLRPYEDFIKDLYLEFLEENTQNYSLSFSKDLENLSDRLNCLLPATFHNTGTRLQNAK